MKNTNATSLRSKSLLTLCLGKTTVLAGLLAAACMVSKTQAANALWIAGGADTNWSTSANWSGGTGTAGVAGPGDNVLFGGAGSSASATAISNVVDGVAGNFGGYISSLQYTNISGFQNTMIASGVTLNITNKDANNNVFTVGSLVDMGAVAANVNISGVGGALTVSNPAANFLVSQGSATAGGPTDTLNMTNLDTFNATINRMAVGIFGTYGLGSTLANQKGTLYLARSNYITANFVVSYPDVMAANAPAQTNSIEIGNGAENAVAPGTLFLGVTNVIFADSIATGKGKSGTGLIAFNPVFINLNPVVYIRGVNATPSSRVTMYRIGDNASGANTSNGCKGTNDFSGGTVDVLVDKLYLGSDKERNTSASNPNLGVLTFTAGTFDVNTARLGNQTQTNNGVLNLNPSQGIVNVNGSGATLKVNTVLVLAFNSTNTPSAQNSFGKLTVTNGTVLANSITVGAYTVSPNNIINLTNATLIVSNALASSAAPLTNFLTANSLLGLTITSDSATKAFTGVLTTGGATNVIQISPTVPVFFASYPAQFALIKYATLNAFNFGLTNVPNWAPGAYLSNNVANKSIDLVLPVDARPVITSQPSPFSGNPGDNVTNTVVISAGSVTPLSYQWYKNGVAVTDGPTGNGSGFSGSTTSEFIITNAQTADSANAPGYTVVITNIYGAVTSSPSILNISAGSVAPTIVGPSNVTAIQGNNATFTTTVAGNPVPAIQWQTNGVNIVDATNQSLTVNNVQYPANDQQIYSITATNVAGKITNSATLTVIVPPAITLQPVSLVVTNTQGASFSVQASGVPAVAYQWMKNGSPMSDTGNITGTGSSNLTFTAVSSADSATYSCTITNQAGATNSAGATLTVNSLMTATAFSPANSATGLCYDTPLYATFSSAPTVRAAGKIQIFNVTNSTTPVDTIDMSQGTLQSRTIGGESFNTYPVIVTASTAAIYPHAGVLKSNATYYVLIDDGVFADPTGAYFVGITATNTWQFTTKAGGPANPTNLVVVADNSGDFDTVQGALDSIAANNTTPTLITVANGSYVEVVDFNHKNNIVMRGQSRNGVVIGYANNNGLNGSTHFRMAVKVNANDIAFDNLTITNSTAQDLSQAEALMIESGAARVIVNNCNVDSYQDTILANISTSKAYINNSLIQGDVDFIWGGGNLFFTNCEVRWLIRTNNTAALGPNPSPNATTDINSNGFSFVSCRLTTLPGANPNDVVGRTRSITNGNTALINCMISTNIGGWAADAIPPSLYRNWYFGCTNDLGSAVTLSNGILLSATDPNLTNASSATLWLYGWVPQLAPNILTQPVNVSLTAGETATFTVSATGISDPVYQWLQNGTNAPYAGANNATLVISNATAVINAATYSVIVSNAAGTVTSSTATLTVITPAPPVMNTNNVQVLGNGSAQFSFSGTQGADYRVWATTNLALTPVVNTWTLVGSGTFGAVPVTFDDLQATNFAQRFYTVTSP